MSQWKFWSEIKLSLNTEKLLLQQNLAQEGMVYLLAKIYSSGPSNFHGSWACIFSQADIFFVPDIKTVHRYFYIQKHFFYWT